MKENVFSAKLGQRCSLGNAVPLSSDVTYIRHMHSPKKREVSSAYLFPGCFRLMKKVFITLGSQASFGK